MREDRVQGGDQPGHDDPSEPVIPLCHSVPTDSTDPDDRQDSGVISVLEALGKRGIDIEYSSPGRREELGSDASDFRGRQDGIPGGDDSPSEAISGNELYARIPVRRDVTPPRYPRPEDQEGPCYSPWFGHVLSVCVCLFLFSSLACYGSWWRNGNFMLWNRKGNTEGSLPRDGTKTGHSGATRVLKLQGLTSRSPVM